MSQFKRKRCSKPAQMLAVYKAPVRAGAQKRRKFQAGADRVGGFYGRFAGPNAEMKFHDVQTILNPTTTGGTITNSVNLITQGTGESERIGRKCVLKHISWKYRISLPSVNAIAPANGDTVRIIVYCDKQANGAAAGVTDILDSAGEQSFYNLANQNRFRILMDRVQNIDYTTMTFHSGAALFNQANVQASRSFNKVLNIPIEFSGVGGNMNEIRSNNVGFLIISNNGLAQVNAEMRIRFTDA